MRKAGVNAELYPDAAKMKKQFSYADSRKIPYVLLAGEEEIKSGKLTLKNMSSGTQESLTVSEIIEYLNKN
jgi:histidyl-tRNA synthetase